MISIKQIATWKTALFILMLLPMLLGLGYGLLYSFGVIGILNTGFTTEHWSDVLLNFNFWKSLLFSFGIGLISVGISLVIALWMVVNWHHDLRKGKLSTLIYLPLAFPATVVGFFIFQSFSKTGFWSRLLYQTGVISEIEDFPSLVNDAYGIGIILASTFIITPFLSLILKGIFENEDVTRFQHIAKSLGASQRQVLVKITLPILLQKAKTSLLLFLIFVIGSYEIPLLLGRQNPKMITVAIVDKAQRFNLNDIPQAYAMAILYVSFLIFLFFGFQRLAKLKTKAYA
ncbi:ABC transporter permease subunit [Psychroflexus gondwanensis]|jgi:putative spermidine/putrescine transport system permease protein|uniref:ABC transporter permease subunit n=1 Tax=Psychroflexus gondwanensis TaxID=251 RepID=UPI0011BF82AF|nr:ABC transporter permease subunit [Psychroflexus gondwanensis]TXE18176.1 ABC transporter permease subunit [Psychroflexus gondwanensis]